MSEDQAEHRHTHQASAADDCSLHGWHMRLQFFFSKHSSMSYLINDSFLILKRSCFSNIEETQNTGRPVFKSFANLCHLVIQNRVSNSNLADIKQISRMYFKALVLFFETGFNVAEQTCCQRYRTGGCACSTANVSLTSTVTASNYC